MARKSLNSSGKKKRGRGHRESLRPHSAPEEAFLGFEDRDYKEVLREIIQSPAAKYVAGGVAVAVLTRIANDMAKRYPEISSFIHQNIESLEDRWGHFGNTSGGSQKHH